MRSLHPRARRGFGGSLCRTQRRPGDSRSCPCSGTLEGLGAAVSATRQQARSCCRLGTGGIDRARCGEPIERCPHAEECVRARPRLGVHEGTHDCDTRRPGLADASASPHRLQLLARIAAGVVASGQWFRPAEQGLTGRAPYGSTEGRSVGQASRDPRLW